MSNKKMSADDVLAVMDRAAVILEIDGRRAAVKDFMKVRAAVADLIAERDALREDAERWRHARQILIVDQIEAGQFDYENWIASGGQVDEEESKRADEAIDAARANEST